MTFPRRLNRLKRAQRLWVLASVLLVSVLFAGRASAQATSLNVTFRAAAYEIAASGSVPSLKVPAVSRSFTAAQDGLALPDVAPGQPVTYVIAVSSRGGVRTGEISLTLGSSQLARLPVTDVPISVTLANGKTVTRKGRGVLVNTRLPAGSFPVFIQYVDPQGIYESSSVTHRINSVPHLAIDLSAGCLDPGGAPALVCKVGAKGQQVIFSSTVAAETGNAVWGPPPAGTVTFDFGGVGSAQVPTPPDGRVTVSQPVPPNSANYTVLASFVASAGAGSGIPWRPCTSAPQVLEVRSY